MVIGSALYKGWTIAKSCLHWIEDKLVSTYSPGDKNAVDKEQASDDSKVLRQRPTRAQDTNDIKGLVECHAPKASTSHRTQETQRRVQGTDSILRLSY
jgi:hypothetical protein